MVKGTLPKTETAVENAYLSCENNKKFREQDKK